jgi:hypothetical protein
MYKESVRKRFIFWGIVAIVIISVFSKKISAQQVTVDNISARSEVYTEVQGNSNVQTHIEVEVNGEKKTLSASGSGRYEVEISSSTPSVTASAVIVNVTPALKQNAPFLVKFRSFFEDLLRNLRSKFRM